MEAKGSGPPVVFAVYDTRRYGWQAERTDEATERARQADPECTDVCSCAAWLDWPQRTPADDQVNCVEGPELQELRAWTAANPGELALVEAEHVGGELRVLRVLGQYGSAPAPSANDEKTEADKWGACTCCGAPHFPDDDDEYPPVRKDERSYCSACWDERVCHRCERCCGGMADLKTCNQCGGRLVGVECCVAICWCQSVEAICRDCVKPEDNKCGRCERPLATPPAYPYAADSAELRCEGCASQAPVEGDEPAQDA